MKALVFSDLHVHNWPAFSRLNENGVNDRLMDTIRVIEDVSRIADEEKVDCILFAGDFFHVPKIEAEVIALAARAIVDRLSGLHIPILAVEGNHDQAARVKSLTSVSGLLVPEMWYWMRRTWNEIEGVSIWGTAYGDHEPPQEPADIALLHRGTRGAAMSDYFNSPFEEDLDRNEAHKWAKQLVICGHFHKPQYLTGDHTPILIPGAPLQHTWGDAGQERNLWTVTIVPGSEPIVKAHVLTGYPQFIRVTEDNFEDLSRIDGNFVSVECSKPLPPKFLDELTAALTARARGFSITAEAPKIVRPVEERIEISGSTELDDVVRQYATKFGGEDSSALAELGVEILKGVQ